MTTPATPACLIGLDMGTTNTRAWLVLEGAIAARARAAVGIRDAAVSGTSASLQTTLGELTRALWAGAPRGAAPACIMAAGMISSAQGLAEVAHIPAPAGVAELAAGAQRHRFSATGELDLYLLPGVRTGAPRLALQEIGSADVMRGEETLCIGLREGGVVEPGGTLLNLGSHWKVVRLDGEGRIAGSATLLSGELLHAAQTRTILAGSVPSGRPEGVNLEWARAGIREACTSGLERALFCVRLLEQRTPGSPGDRLSYLVGAFIGSALPAVLSAAPDGRTLVIAGGGAAAEAFALALREQGREARLLTDEEVEEGMVRGLGVLAGAVFQMRTA
jgi:2-dehydro-3-deoxygalactonokinase